MNKEGVVHTHHGILFSHEKRIKSTTWVGLEGILLSEISQTERQILYNFTYMWILKTSKKKT